MLKLTPQKMGKKFEEQIKQSCEEQDIDVTRLKDAGFIGGEKGAQKRFTPKNICDFILFKDGVLLFAEAKRRKDALTFKSLTQLDDLKKKWKPSEGVFSGVICNIQSQSFFIPTNVLFTMRDEYRISTINLSRAKTFGFEIPEFVPPRKKKMRLDMVSVMKYVYRFKKTERVSHDSYKDFCLTGGASVPG